MESTNANGDTVYTVTTHNPDGSTTETIYTFKTEKDVTLTDKQKEDAAWEALAKAEHKSVEELQKEGYKIDSSTFTDITKTSWTVETKTSTTETTKETLNQTLVRRHLDPDGHHPQDQGRPNLQEPEEEP